MCDELSVGGPRADGSREPTHTAIVLFLAKPTGGGPVLLAPTDLEALFHELGHALDFMLDRSRFAPLDGAAWVGDWVEAPSQSIGRWAVLPDVLAELGRHVVTGERLAVDRAASFAAANEVGAALANLRFLWLSRLDQSLHGAAPVDLDAAWQEAWPIRGSAPSIERFAAAPLMIMALGYDGVMYGFLWSQVLLEEIIGRFRNEGPLAAAVGASYRRDLLEPGWAADPLDRMRRFLGREPSMDAYLARLRT
jgi:thimet oligopeptidase